MIHGGALCATLHFVYSFMLSVLPHLRLASLHKAGVSPGSSGCERITLLSASHSPPQNESCLWSIMVSPRVAPLAYCSKKEEKGENWRLKSPKREMMSEMKEAKFDDGLRCCRTRRPVGRTLLLSTISFPCTLFPLGSHPRCNRTFLQKSDHGTGH